MPSFGHAGFSFHRILLARIVEVSYAMQVTSAVCTPRLPGAG